MSGSSRARSTASIPRRRVLPGVPSLVAWERVVDQRRRKLPGSPSRSAVFGQAGLRYGKMFWMRRQPDLRMSVIVKLARALRMRPGHLLDQILAELPPPPET